MLTSLFSIFDPTGGVLSNWLIMMFVLFMSSLVWTCSPILLMKSLLLLLYKEMKITLKPVTFMFHFTIPIFWSILAFNIIGLLPYSFTLTSHLAFSLAISLPFWLFSTLYGWVTSANKMFTHLVPSGCPTLIIPLMVLIELLSQLIRPLTLSIRLSANIMAGHSIMSLVCLGGFSFTPFMFASLSETVLMLLEISVAIIQPYVFFSLIILYINEVIS